jgi:hypothetical protein
MNDGPSRLRLCLCDRFVILPIADKPGISFCNANHERKEPAGFIGMLNFASEVHASVASPVWQFAPRRASRIAALADTKDRRVLGSGSC